MQEKQLEHTLEVGRKNGYNKSRLFSYDQIENL